MWTFFQRTPYQQTDHELDMIANGKRAVRMAAIESIAEIKDEASRARSRADSAYKIASDSDDRVDDLEDKLRALQRHLGIVIEDNPARNESPPRFIVRPVERDEK